MKLYITPGSPYARIIRVLILETTPQPQIEIVQAKTRTPDSPYYAINPSGRVPYLLLPDGTGLEDSPLIAAWLDRNPTRFTPQDPATAWDHRRLEANARSLMDGLAVWLRERTRPVSEQSPTTINHETARAARLIDQWEAAIAHPLLTGPLNLAQITLACALALEDRNPDFRWRPGHPALAAWYDAIAARPSFIATRPPKSH